MITWADPPAPRLTLTPDDEYWDVIPIPFFPDDLPRLEHDPFWTPQRLDDACRWARAKLFPSPKGPRK